MTVEKRICYGKKGGGVDLKQMDYSFSGYKPAGEIFQEWKRLQDNLPEGKQETIQMFADWVLTQRSKMDAMQFEELALFLTIRNAK